jgi:hypothetical protein
MPDPKRTLVTFLLDRTGSMEAIKDDTIGGFNAYLSGLQDDGELIDFTLVQFDSMGLEKICVAVPVAQAPQLTKDNFVPRASTPLIDAAVKTIKAVEASLNGKDTPKIVVCIQTDGQENASTEHTWEELNALIKDKAVAGWQFNFMGAGIDAYEQGARMGLSADSTLSYDSRDAFATRAAFSSRAAAAADFSRGRREDMSFSADEKDAAGDRYRRPSTSAGVPQGKSRPARRPSVVDDFSLE